MTTINKRLILAAFTMLVASGSALADSGDNSMSPYTGESYAAFYGGNIGAPTRDVSYPLADKAAKEKESEKAAADRKPRFDVIIGVPREATNPFRDDTAA